MSSFGGRRIAIGIWCVAGALACSTRPLDPGAGAPGGAGAAAVTGSGGAPSTSPSRDAASHLPASDAQAHDAADGGAAADALADGPGGPAADGGGIDGPGPDGAAKMPRMLSLVLDGAPWYATQSTQGIAVDRRGGVYVGDAAHVFAVDVPSATVTTYLTPAEVGGTGFGDLDIAPDGRLYVVTAWARPGQGFGVVRSSQAHEGDPWIDLSATLMDMSEMAVIDDGVIGVVSRAGFWTFTDAGGQLIYDTMKLISTDSCAAKDLAAAPSGVFFYLPGCNGYPLLRGRADGAGVAVLYQTAIGQASVLAASNFSCIARDPAGGGFYVIVQNVDDYAPRLFHVAENAQGTSGLTAIETIPSFTQAKQQVSNVFGFDYCSLATGYDGTVYFQSYAQLWKVSP